jgi:hypothetical protein
MHYFMTKEGVFTSKLQNRGIFFVSIYLTVDTTRQFRGVAPKLMQEGTFPPSDFFFRCFLLLTVCCLSLLLAIQRRSIVLVHGPGHNSVFPFIRFLPIQWHTHHRTVRTASFLPLCPRIPWLLSLCSYTFPNLHTPSPAYINRGIASATTHTRSYCT